MLVGWNNPSNFGYKYHNKLYLLELQTNLDRGPHFVDDAKNDGTIDKWKQDAME